MGGSTRCLCIVFVLGVPSVAFAQTVSIVSADGRTYGEFGPNDTFTAQLWLENFSAIDLWSVEIDLGSSVSIGDATFSLEFRQSGHVFVTMPPFGWGVIAGPPLEVNGRVLAATFDVTIAGGDGSNALFGINDFSNDTFFEISKEKLFPRFEDLAAGGQLVSAPRCGDGFCVAESGEDACNCPLDCGVVIERRIGDGNDDGEERRSDGLVSLTSSDLELGNEFGTPKSVGMRFTDIDIPEGSFVKSAFIQFTVDERDGGPTSLIVFGELSPDAAAFSSNDGNITSRPLTATFVEWNDVPSWNIPGEAGPGQRTPDIASVVQEILDQPQWTPGNALVMVIEGNSGGQRRAESFNGEPASAPLLTVTFVNPVASPTCDACPTHPADLNRNKDFELDETSAYFTCFLRACADWAGGGPLPPPASFTSRAGTLFLRGELDKMDYCCDPALMAPLTWRGPGQCGVIATVASQDASIVPGPNVATREVQWQGSTVVARIRIRPPARSTAYAIEENVPPDLTPSEVSHGGLYHAHLNSIRWGPFLDNEPRDLTYQLIGADASDVIGFLAGVVSFDGHDTRIVNRAAGPGWLGDADGDGDVDLADYLHLLECFSATATPIASSCDLFDFDGDGNVGLADFVDFQAVFTGTK